jgi:hypothetical protein
MELYHAAYTDQYIGRALTHFGSMAVSMTRIESTFATQNIRQYDAREKHYRVLDLYGRPVRIETIDETLEAFIDHCNTQTIAQCDVDITAPLDIHDCWMDDPIGSGGMNILDGNTQLTENQLQELKRIFHPFKGLVYPHDVVASLSQKEVMTIIRTGRQNKLFAQEFTKRKNRSLKIGEDFGRASGHEAVWVKLTLDLRQWAIKHGFDGFHYENQEEVAGEPCYVTFNKGQAKRHGPSLHFDEERYRDTVAPTFTRFLDRLDLRSRLSFGTKKNYADMYWAGHDSTSFWKPKTIS